MAEIFLTEEEYTQIGIRARKLRESRGISQIQLADHLRTNNDEISRIETGKITLSMDFLIRYCRYFDISADYLVFGEKNNKTLQKLPPRIVEILNAGSLKEERGLKIALEYFMKLQGLA